MLLAGAIAVALRWRRAHPMLTGQVTATLSDVDGGHTFPLSGRRMTISKQSAGIPGSGSITGARSGGATGRPVVEIAYSRNGSSSSRDVKTCADGEDVTVSGVSFTWRQRGGSRP